MIELTKNEKAVLRLLLDNCRISDTATAKKLGISPQAAGKIRKGLEKKGVIRGCVCELDFEAMGITTFAIVYAKIVPDKDLQTRVTWQKKTEAEGIIRQSPNLLMLAEPIGSEYNYIALFGFRSQTEMEAFIQEARRVYAGILEDRKIDTFSARSLSKFDRTPIFRAMLEDAKPRNPPLQPLAKIRRIIKFKQTAKRVQKK
ncbi:MAG: Lrp/AsnC family transcriptional regulator [Candidatus Micrarchaeota archaeon]